MSYRIPKDPAWCSGCIRGDGGPCEFHCGPDNTFVHFTEDNNIHYGCKAYEPSEWVLSIVGNIYTSPTWGCDSHKGPGKDGLCIYLCIGYDPRHGFWMENLRDETDKRNISERAIGNTYHKMKYWHWFCEECLDIHKKPEDCCKCQGEGTYGDGCWCKCPTGVKLLDKEEKKSSFVRRLRAKDVFSPEYMAVQNIDPEEKICEKP